LPTYTHCGLFSGATSPRILTLVYFNGRPAHTYSLWSTFKGDLPTHSYWSTFMGDLPTHTHAGLLSRATYQHTFTLVYFHGRPAHTYSRWSTFTGNLPTHTHVVYFHGRPAHTYSRWSTFTGNLPTHTHVGLLSRATCPHILTLVYFHEQPALLIGLT